jgi:threonine/homoserine/homoserine lactone efflux protein
MPLDIYLAYLAVTVVVLVIPGPTVLLVAGCALAEGRRAVLPLTAGVMLGDFTALAFSLLGLGALLAVSSTLFTALKLFGAAYLIWLGIGMLRKGIAVDFTPETQAQCSKSRTIRKAWLVTALNPKGMTFFLAFFPQFLNPSEPAWPQLLLMGGTFLVLAGVNALLYGMAAASLRHTLRRPGIGTIFGRIGGGCLIGAGLMTAFLRRAD